MAKQTFEKAMKQLEKIVQDLEEGDIPLEKALNKFEEGMALSKFCAGRLDETEKKVSLLMENSQGRIEEKDFSGEA
jgi:exodeoxyribonuclease VII small subunit